jgi:hypothetical protein
LSSLETSSISIPSDESFAELEKQSAATTPSEEETKKPKGLPMGVNPFGGFNPGQVQLKKSGSQPTNPFGGFNPKPKTDEEEKKEEKEEIKPQAQNPFGGFNPGQVQLKKSGSGTGSQPTNPFGGFKPKPKTEEK